jgi:epoxyqueuosine reductase
MTEMTEKEKREKLLAFLPTLGVSDYGFAAVSDGPAPFTNAISLVVRLSDAVIDEIDGAPTHSYFHHYRTVNTFLDQAMLQLGMFLQDMGCRWLPVAASQSIPDSRGGYQGRYSHKKAACLAGLGAIGKSGLFLHREYGPRVRLGTVFTDLPLQGSAHLPEDLCGSCNLCVRSCPAMAISGEPFSGQERLIDPAACSSHMKKAYQKIGRGSVCGICIRVCPKGGKPVKTIEP